MTTLSAMKARIADELARDDLTEQIVKAVVTAIDEYKYQRFSFNAVSFVDAPASDVEADNAWMTTAELLIRSRAKFELFTHVVRNPPAASAQMEMANSAFDRLKLSVGHNTSTTAGTLGFMKLRIANEMDRSDLTDEIANAISTAIAAYVNRRFHFNATAAVAAPASDGELNNAWMTSAELLIRNRAKAELYANVLKDVKQAADYMALAENALNELRTSRSHTSTTTAGTLGRMKMRIANEIERSDLGDEIADAINTAIVAYEHDRFYFNESRDITFDTVAGQNIYDADDEADLALIQKIDYVKIYDGDIATTLDPVTPEQMESMSANGSSANIPFNYSFYSEQLTLYPEPAEVHTIRIGAVVKVTAPAADDTANNAWMTKAERLIRSRAKLELALHVLEGPKAAELEDRMSRAVSEAYKQLVVRTNHLTRVDNMNTVEGVGF